MRTVQKNVYYCGYCKKHGLSRAAMERHEWHCTMNPARTCRWKTQGAHPPVDLPALALLLQHRVPLDPSDIAWLNDEVDSCPACMLAALRQSGVEYHYNTQNGTNLWDYAAEVERFREAEREHSYGDQW